MKSLIVPTLIRTIGTFLAFCALQYIIPYYLLAIGGFVAGVFMYKTGESKPMSIGMTVGSIAFAIFAYLMAQIYPMQ